MVMVRIRRSRAVAVGLVTLSTFTDIVAYSVAVPVLPDLSRKLGASPTTIGLLFASFGVTLLSVSIPMGAVSDRIGRKIPMVGGLLALAAATLLFAYADGLPWLFAARLVQGAADAVTWVVGFALIADRYGPDERGRVSGIVMSGTSIAFMVGPSIGGWLYEIGGIRAPFLLVAGLALLCALAFAWLDVPRPVAATEPVPIAVLRAFAPRRDLRRRGRRHLCDADDGGAGAAVVSQRQVRALARRGSGCCSRSARSRRRCCTRSTAGSRIASAAVA